MNHKQRIPDISLALSGGGALGFAHIGVLKALHEYEVPVRELSGTSFGAIVAAMAAGGLSINRMTEIAAGIDHHTALRIFRPSLSKGGWSDGQALFNLLKELMPINTFEECIIPLSICCVNIQTIELQYFTTGDLLHPIVASAAVPTIFKPVRIGQYNYFDGGVLENIPLGAFKMQNHAYLAASDVLNSLNTGRKINSSESLAHSIKTVGILALHTMLRDQSLRLLNQYQPGLTISLNLEEFKIWEFWRGLEIIQAGYYQSKQIILNWIDEISSKPQSFLHKLINKQ